MSLNVEGKTLGPFFNKYLTNLDETLYSYFATILLIFMGFYCLASVAMGHAKFGLRFFWLKFYPLVPRETFSNAFFANCLMFNLYACANTMWLCEALSGYITGTSCAKIWNVQIKHIMIWSWFWNHSFFTVWIIVWWFIAFIYFALKPYEKIDLGDAISKKDLQSTQ